MGPVVEGRESLQSRLIHHIQRVELRVRNLDDSLAFYCGVAGLHLVDRNGDRARLGDGSGTVFLTLESDGVTEAADPHATGLFHTAIRFPSRAALGDALARVAAAGLELGAGDHLVSEALYVDDADGNGVELYWDRPVEQWPPPTETMAIPMATLAVNLDLLLEEGRGAAAVADSAPRGTDIGHVHLQVSDIRSTTAFYVAALGLDQTATLAGSAGFFSSNRYHHHIGANVWRSRRGRLSGPHQAGLARVVFAVAAQRELTGLAARLRDEGHRAEEDAAGSLVVVDPDGIELVFTLDEAA